MPFWPVAAREARATARSQRAYLLRMAVGAIGVAIVPIALGFRGDNTGRPIFAALATFGYIYCLLGGMLRTADAIAEEKRENTLGLLFLTDLKSAEILLGKLIASTGSIFLGLLGLLPMLAIPALLGGVTSQELWQTALALLNGLFFSIALGFLLSSVLRRGWIAVLLGIALLFLINIGWPYTVDRIFSGVVPRQWLYHGLLYLSPVGPLVIGINGLSGGHSFWPAFLENNAVAWAFLLLAAWCLPRYWQEHPKSKRAEALHTRLAQLQFGKPKARQKFRARLLNANPLFWLSGREQVSSAGLMVFLMLLVTLSQFGDWAEIYFGLIAMHLTLLVRMASAASHSLAEDRKSGALELLLATSLSVREVLRGRWMALGRQFFGPILIVSLWHLFAVAWASEVRYDTNIYATLGAAWFAAAAAWIAVGWYGLWLGLRARHPIGAIGGALTMVLLAPGAFAALLYSMLARLTMLPTLRGAGSIDFFMGFAFYGWAFYSFLLIAWTSQRVRKHFREAATDRFSDTQPFDWRPLRRVIFLTAAVVILVFGGIYGYSAYKTWGAKTEVERLLRTHPDFQLTPPAPEYFLDSKNLARWDAFDWLNNLQESSWSLFSRFPNRGAGNLLSLQRIDPTRYQAWRKGERLPTGRPAYLSGFDSDFARIHEAARSRPYLRFSRIGTEPFLYGRPIGNIVFLLAEQSTFRIRQGEDPLDDVLLALRFANCVTNEPEATWQFQEMLFAAVQPIHEGMVANRWTSSDLDQIQAVFTSMDALGQHILARNHIIRFMATAPPGSWAAVSLTGEGLRMFVAPSGMSGGWAGRTTFTQAEILHAGLENIPPMVDLKRKVVQHVNDGTSWEPAAQQMFWAIRQTARDVAESQAVIHQVIIACALQKFYLDHGIYPASLAQLKSKYLPEIPVDVATGGQMIYRREDTGYRLYSVAMDGHDNNGVPETKANPYTGLNMNNTATGDWVWWIKK